MLLTLILNMVTNLILEFTLAEIDPRLLKFLEQKGEFTASNGTKIRSGPLLQLGPADSTTGAPRYIYGIGNGLTQMRNKGSTTFLSNTAREIYVHETIIAFKDLVKSYHEEVESHYFPVPYIITLG